MKKLALLLLLSGLFTSCVTTYSKSTVIKHKSNAEVETDSIRVIVF